MATQLITRKRLHEYIDAMPDYGLPIVEPILAHFADEPLIIETDLTAEERADIAEGRLLRQEYPEEFISLEQFLTHGVAQ